MIRRVGVCVREKNKKGRGKREKNKKGGGGASKAKGGKHFFYKTQ